MKAFLLLLASTYYAVITSAFTTTSFTNKHTTSSRFSASSSKTSLAAMPICIVVEAEIKEDRMDEFLTMIEANAVGSRKEPGCIRFGR